MLILKTLLVQDGGKTRQDAACFASVESKALRSKEQSSEMKNANQEIGVPGHAA
jgi:hypothetical protein